jgi:hypothetical protein
MRILELALAGVLAVTVPIAARANERGSKRGQPTRGRCRVSMASDGGGSRGHSGTVGAHPTVRQWDRGWVQPHSGPNGHPLGWGPKGWQGVPYVLGLGSQRRGLRLIRC